MSKRKLLYKIFLKIIRKNNLFLWIIGFPNPDGNIPSRGDDMSADYNQSIVGKRIKKIRKQNSYTQKELAEVLDISVSHLSNLETDKKKLTFAMMTQLCTFFDVSSDYFTAGVLHSNRVSSNIKDMLEQCSDRQLNLIETLIKIILDSSYFE